MKSVLPETTEKLRQRTQSSQRGGLKQILFFLFILCDLCALCGKNLFAESSEAVNVKQLDQTIEKVIQERQYQWRLPRDHAGDDAQKGLIEKFLDGMLDAVKRWMTPVRDWLKRVLDWIRDLLFRSQRDSGGDKKSIFGDQSVLLWILSALIGLMITLLGWRIWKQRRSRIEVANAEAVVPLPDLADDSTVADQLPEEGWQVMAGDLLARGEFRLALRAMYMATLANLARKEMITIAKFKSNRDYQRELRRRAHQYPVVLDAFGENVNLFERVWYGRHEADQAMLDRFSHNQNSMREQT